MSLMTTSTLLAGDMGGTKTLLALYGMNGGKLTQLHQQRFISSQWPSLNPMLEAFLTTDQANSRHLNMVVWQSQVLYKTAAHKLRTFLGSSKRSNWQPLLH